MQEPVRVTIAMKPESVEVFKRMAQAGNMSFSKCVSEWLADTSDAALFVSVKMEEARKAPARVMNEMLGVVAGLQEQVLEVKDDFRTKAAAKGRVAAGVGHVPPPSSNTGVYGNRKRGPK